MGLLGHLWFVEKNEDLVWGVFFLVFFSGNSVVADPPIVAAGHGVSLGQLSLSASGRCGLCRLELHDQQRRKHFKIKPTLLPRGCGWGRGIQRLRHTGQGMVP